MKKLMLIGLIVALALILVGGVGVVYAAVRYNANVVVQSTAQPGDQIVNPFQVGPGGMMNGYGYGYGPGGMMGGYGPGGMMGRRGGIERGYGIMRDYVVAAFAKDVGLTLNDVNTRLSNGETLVQIAEAQGFTGEKLTTLRTQVFQDATSQAVADGAITQTQADRMLQRMKNYTGQGFGLGFGGCPMWDGGEVAP